MKSNYLTDFLETKTAYLPLGTIEWHGNHLPLETDLMIALFLCQSISQKFPGYILPPLYLGTDKETIINNEKYIGMDGYLKKRLPGNVYYLSPNLFAEVLEKIVHNLIIQGFKKIIIISGHAGSKQIAIIEKIEKEINQVIFVNLYNKINLISHADEYETSLLWACYPKEEEKSRSIKISNDDDFIKYIGYDPREKASIEIGLKILHQLIELSEEEVERKKNS